MTLRICVLLTIAALAIGLNIHADPLKAEIQLLIKGGLAESWRSPLGEWKSAGDAGLKPDDPELLVGEKGDGVALNGPTGKTEHLVSKVEHADVRAHIEFMVSEGSNSGVYFMGRYEIQVLDSWGETDLGYGDCGGIYQLAEENPESGLEGRAPRVNASRKPGEWQTFDITFRAPQFDDDGNKIANARFIKVVHNGQVIHENEEVTGPTRAALYRDEKPTGPLMLQGDHGPVAYRNITLTPLSGGE